MLDLDFSVVWENLPYMLGGAILTIQVSAIAVTAGLIIGSAFGLARIAANWFIRLIASIYVEFIRGTPLLVQIMFIYFGLASIGITIESRLLAGALALSLNSGAYVAEIVRSGIQSIDKGQMEAARSLGLTYVQAMRYVIMPQAYRRIIPPLVNEFIMLIKDSSLLSAIGTAELMKRAQHVRARTFADFEIFISIAVIYFIITFTLSKAADYLEKRTRIRD